MRQRLREFTGFFVIFASLCLFLITFALASGAGLSGGQKLFEAKCSQCHGKDAKGVVKMAKVLKVDPAAVDLTSADASKLAAADMELVVTNGKKKMPKFKGKLTEDQIKAVVEYAKSLQGGAVPAEKGKKK
ncbi:MAG TPA: c-type cytochrome [bacterium]|nr:c-type cytochrome [bacterium]